MAADGKRKHGWRRAMDEREKRDHEFEIFVLEQVKRFAGLNARSADVFAALTAVCVIMAVLGIAMGKGILKSLCIGAMSVGFIAARRYYLMAAEDVREAADRMQAAIDDPDFDIPDDYPEDIMSLRGMVCPTYKNVVQQIIACGIMAAVLWLATLILFWVSGSGGMSPLMYLVSLLMAFMSAAITFLTVRALRDLPVARAYEDYLNESAGRDS